METIHYTGAIWQGQAVHSALWELLLRQNLLIELRSGPPPYDVVLGVPHHAAPGVDRIAQQWVNPKNGKSGRTADEATGLSGLVFLTALAERNISARLVIAAHAIDHDPNKTPGCAYWQSVFQEPLPQLLLELHGAANHRRHALELSAGQNKAIEPQLYGKLLAYCLNNDILLAVQVESGSGDARVYKNHQGTGGRLQNPALETQSLSYAGELGLPALHLEMKPIFRQPVSEDAPCPSSEVWHLARAAAKALEMKFQAGAPVMIAAADLGLHSTAFLTRPHPMYQESYMAAVHTIDFSEATGNPDLRIWFSDEFASLVANTLQTDYWPLPEDPAEEYLWLIDQGQFIGRLLILHWLNQYRLENDGQVDYWISDSKRLQGYGRLILRLGLERFKQVGLERVLISCLEHNVGSRKIIEANGGIYESAIKEYDSSSLMRLRFWIDLKSNRSPG